DLHGRGARRNAHRAGPGRRARHCGARSRRDCLGGRRVARRSATRRRRGARGRDRGPGAARAAVHPGGGARVRRRVTLGLAALRAAALGALVLLLWTPTAAPAAAARGGPVTVVSDGAIPALADIPPDLARKARIVLLPRAPFFDAFVASVDGPRRVAAGDTVRLKVSYGTAGMRDARSGMRDATLVVTVEHRRLASRVVPLPDSGVVSTDLTLPASRLPHPRCTALGVRLEGVSDSEPRDDARLFVLEVKPQPSVVLLASPPDWETRFLARTLEDVARVPVRTFIEAEPGGSRWRDAVTLESRAQSEVARAVAGAALVIAAGDPATF